MERVFAFLLEKKIARHTEGGTQSLKPKAEKEKRNDSRQHLRTAGVRLACGRHGLRSLLCSCLSKQCTAVDTSPRRRGAGIMLSNEFPINYFSVSEVEQSFPDFQVRLQMHWQLLKGTAWLVDFSIMQDWHVRFVHCCATVRFKHLGSEGRMLIEQDMFKEGALPGEGGFWRFNKVKQLRRLMHDLHLLKPHH